MNTAKQVTISSKNQITLPSELLRKRKLAPGKKLYITTDGSDIVLTTNSPLRRFLDRAQAVNSRPAPSKRLADPLVERQKLNDEWEAR